MNNLHSESCSQAVDRKKKGNLVLLSPAGDSPSSREVINLPFWLLSCDRSFLLSHSDLTEKGSWSWLEWGQRGKVTLGTSAPERVHMRTACFLMKSHWFKSPFEGKQRSNERVLIMVFQNFYFHEVFFFKKKKKSSLNCFCVKVKTIQMLKKKKWSLLTIPLKQNAVSLSTNYFPFDCYISIHCDCIPMIKLLFSILWFLDMSSWITSPATF